jgi:hypothetical protein
MRRIEVATMADPSLTEAHLVMEMGRYWIVYQGSITADKKRTQNQQKMDMMDHTVIVRTDNLVIQMPRLLWLLQASVSTIPLRRTFTRK